MEGRDTAFQVGVGVGTHGWGTILPSRECMGPCCEAAP